MVPRKSSILELGMRSRFRAVFFVFGTVSPPIIKASLLIICSMSCEWRLNLNLNLILLKLNFVLQKTILSCNGERRGIEAGCGRLFELHVEAVDKESGARRGGQDTCEEAGQSS